MITTNTLNTLRISGLASGIDTDSIIKNLMAVERIPVDKLKQQKQILQWQQEDYRTINNSLRTFRDKVFNMKLQATYLAKKATSSNEGAVGVTATSAAVEGFYTIGITKLAKGITVMSAKLNEETASDGTTLKLSGQFPGIATTISFTLEGSTKNADGSYKQQTFSFATGEKTIYDVVKEINAANLGIQASYDSVNNRFMLISPGTGATQHLKVVSDSNSFLSGTLQLQITSGEKVINQTPTEITSPEAIGVGTDYTGVNAQFTLNNVTFDEPTNTFTVADVTYELRQANVTANVTVSSDTDAIFNSIKDFINAYNDVIGKINAKLAETRHRDYPPLTDDQRKALSDDEIKKWEELARSGLLQNDPLLDGIVNTMRQTMATIVPGMTGSQYNDLSDLGITTGLYEEKGKLYIDEAKLRDAIQKNPTAVMNLFTKSADKYSEKGIAMRLYDDVNNAISQISKKAGSDSTFTLADNSSIGQRLREIDNSINDMEDRLKQVEDRYYRQFTAMEQAINQMNAQSAWLAQQFSMGSR
ncbi:flagellar hook-associated protein 2 [Neomoorella thermoacetica]|uniref:flagellar hook-associated protein 2 n=1 Tax=Neomoorella thermoacetica TaxID=1525 RepID=UPI000917E275|nr:flagellar hook-associated protein 2 [Moorella thermoacetica]OIQ60536.1 flagellar hook-associated protein 2 [Moorella thermoacetica]